MTTSSEFGNWAEDYVAQYLQRKGYEIVDRNYKEKVQRKIKPHPELIDNFHWILMRARRMKKVTAQKMAHEIGEPESVIRMAEQGVLPDDSRRLVAKIEDFLGIRILRNEFVKDLRPEPSKWRSFDMQESKDLTIEDMKNIQMLKERQEIEEMKLMDEDIDEELSRNPEREREDIDEELIPPSKRKFMGFPFKR